VIDHPPVPGTLMAAELTEQPAVLGRLADRHAADRDRVRAALPRGHAGTVLLARGSSDNVAVYGRYLIELAVPATKTVTAQMLAVAAIAAAFDSPLVNAADLGTLPDAVAALLADPGAGGPAAAAGPAYAAATRWADARRLVVTGRGLAYAAALETALKIKETARVHAEGLSSADLLHGPIAALDSRLPVLVVSGGARFAADEAELTARLTAEGVPFAVCGAAANAELPLPAGISEVTAPILATVRGQQLALASSLLRGLNPDAPAGLSKVTATH
jgi:glucosamine--fructose-6-phosphate aminotransferase (isomerizing)